MAEVRHKGRIALLAAAILIVFTSIGIRLAVLCLKPVFYSSEKARVLTWKPMSNRGRILDRNGEILAIDRLAYHVCADPAYIAEHGDRDAVSRYLALEFKMSEHEIAEKLASTEREYVRLRKYVPSNKLKRFKRHFSGVIYTPEALPDGTETNIYLRGVMLEEAPVRSYPKGPLMAHVVGFANREGVGGAGIEQRMDQYLRGEEGLRVSKKDGRGKEIYRTRHIDVEPEDGANVVLTLDQELQYFVEQTIEKMREEFNAQAAWAIVQNVRTGEILAMASSPTYDPNRFSKTPAEWMRNRAISSNYEPGSTMKAATVAAAIEHGVVNEETLIDCEEGYWVYGGKKLEDSHPEGIIPVKDVIKVSSNIGTAKIALLMGNQMLYDNLKAFHFGNRLDIGLPGEEGGIFFSPKSWSKISITRIGMGHEIGVTAMQVLSMMNTIAYDGVQMKPMIVKKVVSSDGRVIAEYKPEELGRPISSDTARRMRKMLKAVTEDEEGTGTKARVEGYSVAGKTGTAQKTKPEGGYYQKNFVSSFVGFLPADNPEIGIIVVADDPGEYTESGRKIKYYGGTVCGPAFKEIAEFAVRYLRIPPDVTRVYIARPDE